MEEGMERKNRLSRQSLFLRVHLWEKRYAFPISQGTPLL